MPSGVRWVLGIAFTLVLLVSLTIGATVGTVYQAGTVSVSVQPRGAGEINVAVPAGVANMALAAVEFVPVGAFPLDHVPAEALDALEHYLPAAQQALDRLAEQPDFVLVEVHSRDETVVVRKEGRKLRVIVESNDGRVDVSIPLSTVKQFTKRLRRLSREI
jgi:hypothetical protein